MWIQPARGGTLRPALQRRRGSHQKQKRTRAKKAFAPNRNSQKNVPHHHDSFTNPNRKAGEFPLRPFWDSPKQARSVRSRNRIFVVVLSPFVGPNNRLDI